MTDEQMRIAIADACGWKKPDDPEVMKFKVGWTSAEKWWMCPKGVLRLKHDIPNYLNDLNAMHEAEKLLLKDGHESDLWLEYLSNLVICAPAGLSSHATARQRCIAYLKTKGLIP